MATKNSLFIVLFLCIGLLSVRCSMRLAGVETTNGCTVVATATSIEGTAPPLSRVFIFNERYIPYIDSGIGMGTAADGEGAFRFSTSPGAYHVFIIGPTGEAANLSVESPGSSDTGHVSKNGRLRHPGAVSGAISSAVADTLLVFLSGMCHYQLLCAERSFFIKNVPEGTYLLEIARLSGAPSGLNREIVHEERVAILPDDTATVGAITY